MSAELICCVAVVVLGLWVLVQVIEGPSEISQKERDDMQDWIDKYGGLEYGPGSQKPEEA